MADTDWEDILNQIDDKVGPDEMDQEEALEALEELAFSLQTRIDALKEDIG